LLVDFGFGWSIRVILIVSMMFRRPKVQFKPKVQAVGERKQRSPVKVVADVAAQSESPSEPAVVPDRELSESSESHVVTAPAECLDGETVIIESSYELQNVTASHIPLNCLSGESFEPSDSLTTPEVLIETSDVFAVPHVVQQPQRTADTRPVAVVPETRKAVTIKAKETAAALTVSGSAGGTAHQSDSRDKRQEPRKPKICLSSNRIRLPIDKSKVTMFDLLSYNPPMSEEQKERRRKADEDAELLSHKSSQSGSPAKSVTAASAASVSSGSPAKDDQSKGTSAGPRVKIGLNGEIVIDEESLIVSKKVDVVTDTVYEGSDPAHSQVTYASFRNKNMSCRKSRWSDEETVKFYKALSAVGTDFSLMSKVFFNGSRNRLDLRNKYKKEEKLNQHLIDRALENTDLSLLDEIDLQLADDQQNADDQNIQPVPTTEPANDDQQADCNEEPETVVTVTTKVRTRRRVRASVDSDDSFTPHKVRRGAEPTDAAVPTRRSTRHRK
jgi:transcription factor TFIIIB component B''